MKKLIDWSIKWQVPYAALVDLQKLFGLEIDPVQALVNESDIMNEATVQNMVRLEGKHYGVTLWRNNVGALQDKGGRLIRYGLCNDSKQLNDMIKSGDLIGIKPVLITREHVGQTIGQFVSRETKKSNWSYTGDAHELAQVRWMEIITSLGGDAAFANNKGSFK